MAAPRASLLKFATRAGRASRGPRLPPMRSLITLGLALFASGVVALQLQATLPSHALWLVGGGAGLVLFATRAARRAGVVAACVGAGLLGFGYAGWRAETRLADALPPQWEGVDIRVIGVVDDLPQPVGRGVRFA